MVEGERDGLKQVLINLMKNGAEAMAEGGGGRLWVRTRVLAGGWVEIVVEDEGPGVGEEVRGRLFEPFVSSKGTGHSGLGLSVVHSLVQGMKGTVRCESEQGRGTRFCIELPLSEGEGRDDGR
jgi:signal transduction histidine kinase